MKEYIEKDTALETTYEPFTMSMCMTVSECNGMNRAREIIFKQLRDIPAADVVEVRHGRWETVMLDHERMGCRPTAHYCSECHQITWFRTFYCPNCGAKMDGGVNDA